MSGTQERDVFEPTLEEHWEIDSHESATTLSKDDFESDLPTGSPASSTGRSSGRSERRGLKRAGIVAAVLLVVAAGAFFVFPHLWAAMFGKSNEHPELVLATVKKDRFVVAVTERGVIGSLKNSTLSNNVEGTTTIIFIVPEGTDVKAPLASTATGHVREIQDTEDGQHVIIDPEPIVMNNPYAFLYLPGDPISHFVPQGKYTKVLVERGDRVVVGETLAGDVVCELDSSSLVEKEKQQQIVVTQTGADLEKGRKNVEIQINQNLSDIAKARLALDLARLDLKKFEQGERAQQANVLKGDVLIAQEEYTQAQENHEFNKRLARQGLKSQVELETFRIAMVKARNKLAVAREALKVKVNFEFERTYKELKENADEAERELKRVKLSGLAALAQFNAQLRAYQLTYSVELEKLRRLQRQIKACRLVAPQNGKVVYANQRSRRSEQVVIEEGVTVRERQKIINLPDFSQMKVEVKIHESKISNIRESLPALIHVDALPERVFKGRVDVVPDVPVKGEWPNTDMMLFETQVRIVDEKVTDLKPGMNAKVEIIADERENVLQVPIQALVPVGDGYVAYVLTEDGPQLRRNITIGASNSKMVEIAGGLEEGDRVVMNPKSHFADQIADLRNEALKVAAKRRKAAGSSPAAKPKSGSKANKNKKKRSGKSGKRQPRSFEDLDKNKDGFLSKQEVAGPMAQFFDRIDANKDGKISRDELEAARRKAGGG